MPRAGSTLSHLWSSLAKNRKTWIRSASLWEIWVTTNFAIHITGTQSRTSRLWDCLRDKQPCCRQQVKCKENKGEWWGTHGLRGLGDMQVDSKGWNLFGSWFTNFIGSIFYKEKIKSVILKVTRYLIILNNHEYLQCTNGIVLFIKRMSPFSDEYWNI